MKDKRYLFAVIAMIIIPLFGCEIPIQTNDGKLIFDGYITDGKPLNGYSGTINFGTALAEPVEKCVKSLKMTNSGTDELTITNVSIVGDAFSFLNNRKPDLPLRIPAGKTVDELYMEFYPESAGGKEGMLQIDTDSGLYYFELYGTGLWQLTITLDAGDECTVSLPVEVEPGNSGFAVTSGGSLELSCVLANMQEFDEWEVVSAHTIDNEPLFGGDEEDPALTVGYAKTTVKIRSHTEINPVVYDPYLRVNGVDDIGAAPPTYASIQAAIDDCAPEADPPTNTVVVTPGYVAGTDSAIELKSGVSLKGGYNSDYSSRAYKTTADRANSTYATEISITGTIDASYLGSDTVIEGFTINKTGTDPAPVILLDETEAGVYYNTVNASAHDAPIHAANGTTSIISCNVINGGTTTGDYSHTYGIMVTNESKPVIYKNTISGGSTSGAGSKSFGVFCEFDSRISVLGNTITGGGGEESYGIYLVTNGKVYAYYNDIDGGTGITSRAVYTNYGGNLYLKYNNIHTSGGTTRYGVYSGFQGRVRELSNCGIYDCGSGLLVVYVNASKSIKTAIKDVNDYCNTDTDVDQAITIPDYVEVSYE